MFDTLLFASTNTEKIREVSEILEDVSIEIQTVQDFPGLPDVEETGSSFFENAFLKAESGYRFSGVPTVAEDAGLEVFGLKGEPGIFSSRYKGDIPQSEKNMDIIRRLDEIADADRRARFHSVFVCMYGPDSFIVTEGLCYGRIGYEPAGDNGFGYDPIFMIDEIGKTFAELDSEIKNRISHRHNGLAALRERLSLANEERVV